MSEESTGLPRPVLVGESAGTPDDLMGRVAHGVLPCLWVVAVEAGLRPLLAEWADEDHAALADLGYDSERTALTTPIKAQRRPPADHAAEARRRARPAPLDPRPGAARPRNVRRLRAALARVRALPEVTRVSGNQTPFCS